MKDKNVAGILALFFGTIGVHRFYLGQIGWGIFYAILAFTGISFVLGLIDAIVFFSMDKDAFDINYNKRYYRAIHRDEEIERRWQYPQKQKQEPQPRQKPVQTEQRKRPAPKANPHKKRGIEKYRDYDYDGAIVEFEKALEVEPRDIALHFNLACAYSLNERTEKALHHLDRAVALGFNDFNKIREHDALAFLRIQEDFEAFQENNYRIPGREEEEREAAEPQEVEGAVQLPADQEESTELLEQLRKLNTLREKGLLTEKEFADQKKKLFH